MTNINKPIIIIQNTEYHFETLLSIYQSILSMGLNPYVYQCKDEKYGQKSFLLKNNIQLASDEIIHDACCGFVVSAYPNPKVSGFNCVPSADEKIFDILKNKIIYICHRFYKEKDYLENAFGIDKHNSICLSPLAANIGIDYFHPVEMPIEPFPVQINGILKLTTQAHFELHNRDYSLILNIIEHATNKNDIRFQFLGTNSSKLKKIIGFNHIKKVVFYENLKENYFYKILNNFTNFLILCIDNKIKDETYAKERYSSNFNHALAFEKPVFSHEFFEDIYKLPGIYYNEKNKYDKIEEMINIKQKEYEALIDRYKKLKQEYREHNSEIIDKKIKYIL